MFGSLMREMERDPIFGAHSRAMNRMMNGMNPFFGDFSGGGGGGFLGPGGPMGMDLMPFGMGPMGGMGMGMGGMGMGMGMVPMGLHNFPGFRNMDQMTNQSVPNQFDGASFSSTSVMSMSMNGNGSEPIVYQASSATRQGPGGVKETRKTVCDSRSGVKKMQVGRHLGGRGHVVEREENLFTGQREENEELVNLDFEEKPDFDREWRNRIHGGVVGGGNVERHAAITAGPSAGDSHSSMRQHHHHHHPHPHNHHHHHGGSSSTTTYGPGLTIEEVVDDEEETSTPTHRTVIPPIPRVSSPSHRRAPKDRRHKTSTSSSKRTKKN